ncbi:MAG: hypothetical protein GXP10_07340 [Gammaproteobacteria bacterium]|nr:hypothetical protein [Gammaproteobacteria bacterium]
MGFDAIFLRGSVLLTLCVGVAGCVDPDNPEFDEVRYEAMQDVDCEHVAKVSAWNQKEGVDETKEKAKQRCKYLKSLSFDAFSAEIHRK